MTPVCTCKYANESCGYCISQDVVKTELKRLVYVEAYLPLTCLSNMRLVDDFLADPALPFSPHNRQYALSTILTHLIRNQYIEQRLLFQCKADEPVSYRAALSAICEDAQMGSHELRGWSYLYYVYVRIEFNITHSLYAQIVCSSERNVRRWQQHVLGRLTMKLIEAEHQARKIWQQRLLAEPGLSHAANLLPHSQVVLEEN